jgi:hypothetical protein
MPLSGRTLVPMSDGPFSGRAPGQGLLPLSTKTLTDAAPEGHRVVTREQLAPKATYERWLGAKL